MRGLFCALPFLAAATGCSASSLAHDARTETLTLVSGEARLAARLHLPAATGPVPAVVIVHGSGRVTADALSGNAERLRAMGLAALVYDKRGVGASTGHYAGIGPANSEPMFDLLAGDALAAVEALRGRAEVDRERIGLLGISQGGWIAPLAASRSDSVAFVVSLSGPAVTVGEEIAYSNLAGADPGSEVGLSDAEIERRFAAFMGPHGYDPLPVLRRMRAPSLWILGERDRSLPVARSLANLERVKREADRPIDVRMMPGADHNMREAETGVPVNVWTVVDEWLRARAILRTG